MKFNKWTIALAATGVVSLAGIAQAEESHPVNTALSSTTLSGFVDTSAIWDLGTGDRVANRFANTGSDRLDGFNLNYVKLQLEKPIDEGTWSAGYKTEIMFGPDATVMPGRLGGGSELAIKQAYIALRAPVGNGIDFKIGQFDPIVGYEVTDSYANPNFSRSLAFNNLEPFGHQGILATYQFNDVLGFSAGVANSANNSGRGGVNGGGSTLGNINAKNNGFFNNVNPVESYKSYMAGIVLKAPESTGWLAGSSLYAGIVKGLEVGENNDPVTYYVGGSLATPWQALTIGAAYDYLANGVHDSSYANAVSVYLNFQATEKLKLNGRFEYATSSGGTFLPAWMDANGNTVTADNERLIAVTGTADYALFANVVTRVEVRWDSIVGGSNLRAFGGGMSGDEKNDVSIALNVIYKF
jgi:hypothetical protein